MSDVAILVGKSYKCEEFKDAAFLVLEVYDFGLLVKWYRASNPDIVYGSDFLRFKPNGWQHRLVETAV